MSLLIKNGLVITASDKNYADIFIENEIIKRIEPHIDVTATNILMHPENMSYRVE